MNKKNITKRTMHRMQKQTNNPRFADLASCYFRKSFFGNNLAYKSDKYAEEVVVDYKKTNKLRRSRRSLKNFKNNSKLLSLYLNSSDHVSEKRVFIHKFLQANNPQYSPAMLVLYFTLNGISEIKKTNMEFVKVIEQRFQKLFGKNAFVLVLPVATEEQVRAECWWKGRLLRTEMKKIFENNIFVFNYMKQQF